MSYLGMKQLLEAGVHFGHETKRWNPKMKRFIFAERNGIFIIDLQKTLVESDKALDYLKDLAGRGGTILFVGTKKQAQEILAAEAKRCGMPFINERWLGGLLTNFRTIRGRVERLKELEAMFEDESILRYGKKEQIELGKELHRLQRYLGGLKDMHRLPDALFIVDPTKEAIAAKEANKLGIPCVALADTDSDPDVLDYIIPGNDDAIRSIQLVTARLADAIVEVKGGADAAPVDKPMQELNEEDRQTLKLPVSSPERTIQAAAAGGEGPEAAAPTPKPAPAPAAPAASNAATAPDAPATPSQSGEPAADETSAEATKLAEEAPAPEAPAPEAPAPEATDDAAAPSDTDDADAKRDDATGA
ncbi:MAG: 30S ribosomal protein S2 [Trueperaceae bacterium]